MRYFLPMHHFQIICMYHLRLNFPYIKNADHNFQLKIVAFAKLEIVSKLSDLILTDCRNICVVISFITISMYNASFSYI